MENGDISSFPKEMYRAFSSKQIMVTPVLLHKLIGSDKIELNKYDIYAMGKKKGSKEKYYWTKLQIKYREHSRNGIQGYLSVSFIAGYGFQQNKCDNSLKIIRPTSIGRLVSDDGAVFKKRAMINVNGTYLPLQMAEGFCVIPLLSSRQMKMDSTFKDSKLNSSKRKAYASCQISQQKWAHINRRTMEKDQKISLHSMLLPYKKNLSDKKYFSEFTRDIVKNLNLLKNEFNCVDVDLNDINLNDVNGKCPVEKVEQVEQVEQVNVSEESEVNEEINIENIISNIPMSDIEW